MVFMFLRQREIAHLIFIAILIIASLFFHIQPSYADTVTIKSVMQIHRQGGYVIMINYVTCDEWTDNLLFKVYCEFDRGEVVFTSSSLNNIERGWHKTEITISDLIKRRYGSLKEYRVDLY